MTLPAALSGGTKVWSPDQIAFQHWLALPPALREPRSQRELATHLEVHEVTLSTWRKLPGFGQAVCLLTIEYLKRDLPDVLRAQVKEAKKGSLEHAKWLFEVAGLWNPKAVHEHQGAGGGPLRIVIETVDDRVRPDIKTLEG